MRYNSYKGVSGWSTARERNKRKPERVYEGFRVRAMVSIASITTIVEPERSSLPLLPLDGQHALEAGHAALNVVLMHPPLALRLLVLLLPPVIVLRRLALRLSVPTAHAPLLRVAHTPLRTDAARKRRATGRASTRFALGLERSAERDEDSGRVGSRGVECGELFGGEELRHDVVPDGDEREREDGERDTGCSAIPYESARSRHCA